MASKPLRLLTLSMMQVSGRVDQSAGMLDDEVREKGYALLCVSEPLEDCKIATIEEVPPWVWLGSVVYQPWQS